MKNLLKSFVAFFLGVAARTVVRKYRPTIVMITGSVGKTSTKDAVSAVLSKRFLVRKSDKSFNSEFGVPFTILGVPNPWGNPSAWLRLVKSSLALILLPNHYPNMLVLEVGADKPGDLTRILRIATPDAVVVTRLPDIPVHVEAYTSPEHVQEEEFSPAYALRAAAPLVIPVGRPHLREMAERTPARIMTYGETSEADVHISHIKFHKSKEGVVDGMSAKVSTCGHDDETVVYGSVGKVQALPLAAAITLASAFGIGTTEALKALEEYDPPPGRGRLFAGRNESIIVDDSYNSSPVAVEEALDTLKHFPGAKRRVAILGDMLELGRYSLQEHERIGKIAASSADLVITVGIRSRRMASDSTKTEFVQYDDSTSAARGVIDLILPGDVILIKGSQSIRTERIVAALLNNPDDVSMLVRQDNGWRKV